MNNNILSAYNEFGRLVDGISRLIFEGIDWCSDPKMGNLLLSVDALKEKQANFYLTIEETLD